MTVLEELIDAAFRACDTGHAHGQQHVVGAALLTRSGKMCVNGVDNRPHVQYLQVAQISSRVESVRLCTLPLMRLRIRTIQGYPVQNCAMGSTPVTSVRKMMIQKRVEVD